MSDIKLFKIKDKVQELTAKTGAIEKNLQNLIENNMLGLFGIRFM